MKCTFLSLDYRLDGGNCFGQWDVTASDKSRILTRVIVVGFPPVCHCHCDERNKPQGATNLLPDPSVTHVGHTHG